MAPNWYESAEQVRLFVRRPVYTLVGFVHLRFVEQLPDGVLQLLVDDRVVPVLPTAEVRRADEGIAELLDRHERRQAEAQGRRTV